ncbi:hypothetical protein [Marivita sp. S2033]|uniref:hypothetical protein n=1 Tax=Marivita sp. S2033 TaxID=3373187 RepID=UPI0039825F4A
MVLIGVAFGTGAVMAAQGSLYPAAQCAAFWLGYEDYAQVSPYLDTDADAATAAAAFRKVALRLGGAESAVDAYIAEQRPLMALLMEGYIYGNDTQSREVFEDLSAICQEFADRHPETRDLK